METDGGATANKRVDWGIDIKDWAIKPMRRQSKGSVNQLTGFRHRDVVRYTKKMVIITRAI